MSDNKEIELKPTSKEDNVTLEDKDYYLIKAIRELSQKIDKLTRHL